jgi:hypothetical protein
LKIPFQTPVTLQSNLIQAEVVMRLQEAVISRFAVFKSRSTYPVAGAVKQDRCSLETRTFYQNGFKRVLNLRFEQRLSGTILTGEFALRKPTLIFGAIWFGFLSIFTVIWTIDFFEGNLHNFTRTSTRVQETPADWTALVIPYFMLILGWLILRVGLWLSRRTEGETLRFVERVVSAQQANPEFLLP